MTHRSLADASTSRRRLIAGSAAAAAALATPMTIPSPAPARAQEAVEVTIARGESAIQPIRDDAPVHVRIAETTGVRLSFEAVPSADWTTRFQTLLATDQVPDLMAVGSVSQVREFVDDEVLLPLNQLIADNAPNVQSYLAANPQFDSVRVDGELYYLPMLYFNVPRDSAMPVIRMDILEQLGLTPPTTLDELPGVIAQMKAATPGSVGWTNRYGTTQILGIMAYPLGSGSECYFDEEVNGGQWVYGPITPEFRYVLEYLTSAYANGVLDPEFAITTVDDWQTKNSSGQGLFTWDNMGFASNWNTALRATNPDLVGWQPLNVLAGPKGARARDFDFIREGWAIGANTKDPAAIMKMIDWLLTPEGIDTTNWGIEGQHFTRNMPLPATIADYSRAGLEAAMPADRNTILPDLFARYGTATDPARAFQSDIGAGLLDFSLALDGEINLLWRRETDLAKWFEITAADPGLRSPVPDPPFTLDEAEQLTDLNRMVTETLEPAYDQVILGQITLDDYAGIAESIASSAQQIQDIYNAAQDRLG